MSENNAQLSWMNDTDSRIKALEKRPTLDIGFLQEQFQRVLTLYVDSLARKPVIILRDKPEVDIQIARDKLYEAIDGMKRGIPGKAHEVIARKEELEKLK